VNPTNQSVQVLVDIVAVGSGAGPFTTEGDRAVAALKFQGALKKKPDPSAYLINLRGTNQPQNIFFSLFFLGTFLGVSR
jgi:hypothetical protein